MRRGLRTQIAYESKGATANVRWQREQKRKAASELQAQPPAKKQKNKRKGKPASYWWRHVEYSFAEAAELLGLTVGELNRLTKAGVIRSRHVNGKETINAGQVNRYLTRRETKEK